MQFVEFILGREYFAVNLFHTREVLTPEEITPLPNTPAYIRAVMDLRWSVTTIIDLKKLMNLTEGTGLNKRSRIIILDQQPSEKPIRILVDHVYSVSTYRSTDNEKEIEGSTQYSMNIMGVIRKAIKEGE